MSMIHGPGNYGSSKCNFDNYGLNATIRHLTDKDLGQLIAHLQWLDRKARIMRFGGNVSDHFLANYAGMPRGPHFSAVGYFNDGGMVGLGQLTFCGKNLNERAEAALSVDAEWRDRGIGTALLGRLLNQASEAGAQTLRLLCMPLNLRLVHVAQKFQGVLVSDAGDLLIELPLVDPAVVRRQTRTTMPGQPE